MIEFTPNWRNLETDIRGSFSVEEALTKANLNWGVEQRPLYLEDGTLVDNYFVNVKNNTNETLGIVTNRYKILQNLEAFDFVDDIIQQQNIRVEFESAGSTPDFKRVWLMLRMPDTKILDDPFANYLFLFNSHDGKSAIKIGVTPTRISCINRMNLVLKNAPRLWTARHSNSIEERKVEASESLLLASNHIKSIADWANEMVRKKADINSFLDKFFIIPENASNRVLNNVETSREQILSIYNKKDDLGNLRGNAWGIYNTMADWVSNSEPLRKSDTFELRRFQSLLDGNDNLARTQILLSA